MHVEAADSGDFAVVVADHYLRPELREFTPSRLRAAGPGCS